MGQGFLNPSFRSPGTELWLCCVFLQEIRSPLLCGTPRLPECHREGHQISSFPTEDWKGVEYHPLYCPPSCTATALLGRRRGRLRSDFCQERPGAHYIFFETPVKTGINTWVLELQAGSYPLLIAVWRLQSKLVEIRDSSNSAIQSQEPSVVRFNSHRSVNMEGGLEGPWGGRSGKADQQDLCWWFYRKI